MGCGSSTAVRPEDRKEGRPAKYRQNTPQLENGQKATAANKDDKAETLDDVTLLSVLKKALRMWDARVAADGSSSATAVELDAAETLVESMGSLSQRLGNSTHGRHRFSTDKVEKGVKSPGKARLSKDSSASTGDQVSDDGGEVLRQNVIAPRLPASPNCRPLLSSPVRQNINILTTDSSVQTEPLPSSWPRGPFAESPPMCNSGLAVPVVKEQGGSNESTPPDTPLAPSESGSFSGVRPIGPRRSTIQSGDGGSPQRSFSVRSSSSRGSPRRHSRSRSSMLNMSRSKLRSEDSDQDEGTQVTRRKSEPAAQISPKSPSIQPKPPQPHGSYRARPTFQRNMSTMSSPVTSPLRHGSLRGFQGLEHKPLMRKKEGTGEDKEDDLERLLRSDSEDLGEVDAGQFASGLHTAADIEKDVLRAIGHDATDKKSNRSSIPSVAGSFRGKRPSMLGESCRHSEPDLSSHRGGLDSPRAFSPDADSCMSSPRRAFMGASYETIMPSLLNMLTKLTKHSFAPQKHLSKVMNKTQGMLNADGACFWTWDSEEVIIESYTSTDEDVERSPHKPNIDFRRHFATLTQKARRVLSWPLEENQSPHRRNSPAGMTRRQSRRFSDADKTEILFTGNALASPVRSGEAVIAVAMVWWDRRGPERRGTDADKTLFEALTQIAGVATRDTRLLKKAVQQQRKAQAMLNVAACLGTVDLGGSGLTQAIMENARTLTSASRCCLFVVHETRQQLQAELEGGGVIIVPIGAGLVGHVAATGECLNMKDVYEDPRFNPDVDELSGSRTRSMLCLPVVYESKIVAVAQLINKQSEPQFFTEEDIDFFDSFAVFAGLALRNVAYYSELMFQRKTTEVVLQMVRQLAETDIRSISSVTEKVITGAKELCHADRCALFLVDDERQHLVAEVGEGDDRKEIRVPFGVGFVGDVAQSGSPLNIADAYADPRFNQDVDKKTGYRTKGIMAYPIQHQGQVIAVAQLINKVDPLAGVVPFGIADEELLVIFGEFAGVTIGNARLYDFVLQAGNQAMDLFAQMQGADVGQGKEGKGVQFASVERAGSLQDLEEDLTDKEKATLDTDAFPVHEYSEDDDGLDRLATLMVVMLRKIGLMEKYKLDEDVLYRMLATVRNMYRPVPYHNFAHAFDVTQTLYYYMCILGVREQLSDLDVLTLMMCGIFHDVDHMGLNNSFHLKAETPLGMLSSASGSRSVLEVHHCSIAIEILQNEETNVLAPLAADDSKQVFKVLINTILATDMARHGEICADMKAFIESGTPYDASIPEHKSRIVTFLMKCADISNPCKPFEIGKKWGIKVTEEFHSQGEQEKKSGVSTLPAVMLAGGHREFAKGQDGFSSFVVLPMYELGAQAMPKLAKVRDQCRENRDRWRLWIKKDVMANVWGRNFDHGVLYCFYFKLSGFCFERQLMKKNRTKKADQAPTTPQ
eukprot:Hpha_TRINITY_DN11701_c0_g1::TRINITY_DN11701_c0_g1_i1::g.31677::m.31677/K13298/PDE11; dual 3',5'-cyclic-AMP and -GMP phosphodiesterase 11